MDTRYADLQNQELNDLLGNLPEMELDNRATIEAETRLDKLGIPAVDKPGGDAPRYPEDLSLMDDLSLGKLYGQFMAFSGYCKYLVHLKDADILYAQNMLSTTKKVVKKKVSDISDSTKSKVTVDAKRDLVDGHPVVMALERALTTYEIQKKVAESRYSHYESCARALSREVARRELANDRRGGPR